MTADNPATPLPQPAGRPDRWGVGAPAAGAEDDTEASRKLSLSPRVIVIGRAGLLGAACAFVVGAFVVAAQQSEPAAQGALVSTGPTPSLLGGTGLEGPSLSLFDPWAQTVPRLAPPPAPGTGVLATGAGTTAAYVAPPFLRTSASGQISSATPRSGARLVVVPPTYGGRPPGSAGGGGPTGGGTGTPTTPVTTTTGPTTSPTTTPTTTTPTTTTTSTTTTTNPPTTTTTDPPTTTTTNPPTTTTTDPPTTTTTNPPTTTTTTTTDPPTTTTTTDPPTTTTTTITTTTTTLTTTDTTTSTTAASTSLTDTTTTVPTTGPTS